MDKVKAKQLEEALLGKCIQGCKVGPLVNNGKSAAVFLATKDGNPVALKIFDDELIEKYGDATQLARIDRELELVGKRHPNMVEILGGGFDDITKNHFIVMEYLNGPNLKECLSKVPAENIPELVQQLASAAKFLEGLGLVHRDIKPENIVLLDDLSRLVLLDFGVIRPIGKPGLTDDDGILTFVGTLQYSSPEFLLRNEDDTELGWRALTFYQIGGVIHDLIMRLPLFEEFLNPYARLVNAVQHEVPVIQNSAVPAYLTDLAGACLLKDPVLRARLVDWSKFEKPELIISSGESAKQRVTNRALLIQAREKDKAASSATVSTANEVLGVAIDYIKQAVRSIRNDNNVFPPLTVIADGSGGQCVKVSFRNSDAHGLPLGLSLHASIEILDASARVLSISALAFVSMHPDASEQPSPHVFFEGIYDGAAIYTALEGCVYEALEAAQAIPLTEEVRASGRWITFNSNRG